MTPEREKEIRDRLKEIRATLTAFKHWKSLSDGPSSYLESHGPDMEELLAELDRVRGKYMECATTKDGFAISLERIDNENSETQMENVQLRAKLELESPRKDQGGEMKLKEKLAIESVRSRYGPDYHVSEHEKGFIEGFETAREMARIEAIQLNENPEVLKIINFTIGEIGEEEVK